MEFLKTSSDRSAGFRILVVLPILVVALLWSIWPCVHEMFDRWSHDARYSHGFLVPFFSCFLLWYRRGMLAITSLNSSGWGILLLAIGATLYLVGARYFVPWIEALSLLPSLAGLALLVGGWQVLRWAGPSIGFLFFMIPLPYRFERALGAPLQRIATIASNYALQTLGLPAVAEGNIILLDDVRIGIVEACNGLGMLFTFFAFAVGVALIIKKHKFYEKMLIVVSAVPIALIANITRITVTGVLYVLVNDKVADAVYHDLAGWLMMPLALTLIWVELALLSHLFVDAPDSVTQPIGH